MTEAATSSGNDAGVPAALILAAGRGSRLKEYTRDRPKCLLEIGEHTIIEHQIQALKLAGISTIQVITGYGADLVRSVCGNAVTYAHNEHYDSTNSFDSFGCTSLSPGSHGFLVLNSDVLFPPALVRRLLASPRENALLADFEAELGVEEMKIAVDAHDRIVAISKSMNPNEAQAENLGVLRLGPTAAEAMLRLSREGELSGSRMAWLPDGIHHLREDLPFHAISAEGFRWTEIDFEEDLLRARDEIYPLIHDDLWDDSIAAVSPPAQPGS